MSTFPRLHGSTENASGWELLAAKLESRVHLAVCPELTADNPEASSAYHVEAAASALRKISDPPIVVARSVSDLICR
jgi:hypothetical protein